MENNDALDAKKSDSVNEKTETTETKAKSNAKTDAVKKKSFWQFIKKYPVFITAFIGLLAVAGVYFWKDIQGKQKTAEVEKIAAVQLEQNLNDMLKLMAKPLIWSIRSEMLRDNIEQVNIFTNDLVKEKNFQYIHIVDPSGNIIVSTDKKHEGQSANGLIDNNLLQTDSVVIVNTTNEILTLATPIMGYDKRLGTLVLSYKPEHFVVKVD